MFKNLDYKETYCLPEDGNVRYSSSAQGARNGWAYIYTTDKEYVADLSTKHIVQVSTNDDWVQYVGQALTIKSHERNYPLFRSEEEEDSYN
jgi:hypothetical protein